ncbi:hypothetical protein CEXT_49831 [Caerostris extrusa]|uniref:Uncharacterized protein n=1 Tax=Caerostris extrusa TaxID=172846 RepID=A0AAV4UKK6_CAEEX|nr:hypothetical protein CEXT_49831 [Caerostris extrusa]
MSLVANEGVSVGQKFFRCTGEEGTNLLASAFMEVRINFCGKMSKQRSSMVQRYLQCPWCTLEFAIFFHHNRMVVEVRLIVVGMSTNVLQDITPLDGSRRDGISNQANNHVMIFFKLHSLHIKRLSNSESG